MRARIRRAEVQGCDLLAAQPLMDQRWVAFKDEQVRLRLASWLESIGVEAEGVKAGD